MVGIIRIIGDLQAMETIMIIRETQTMMIIREIRTIRSTTKFKAPGRCSARAVGGVHLRNEVTHDDGSNNPFLR